jgi:voltage-gated potassium channel
MLDTDTADRHRRFGKHVPRLGARSDVLVFLRRLAWLSLAIVALIALGTLGFVVTEGVSAWLAFRWTLDTVATVGSIPPPHDTAGQALVVVLIVLGVGTLFYALVTATEFFVSGHATGLLYGRRQQRMIDSLSDHYLICGFGRVGRQVARDLRAANARYVVIDENPDNRELAEAVGVGARFIEGSPSDDQVLRSAGIERARAVVACVDSDAENIFITLTARELRDDIAIVARAAVEDSEKKLKRAGADRVISPYKASGAEMARLALHPQVTGVVDVAPEYRMEEIEVTAGCAGEGKTVGDVRGGSFIVAMRRADGAFAAQPPGETVLGAGDVIVAMGTPRTMERLEHLFEPAAAATLGPIPLDPAR